MKHASCEYLGGNFQAGYSLTSLNLDRASGRVDRVEGKESDADCCSAVGARFESMLFISNSIIIGQSLIDD